MVEHVYVNLTNGPVTVSLPSGAGFEVKVGEAVRGAHFLRTAQAGVLIPIEGCPKHMRPTVIHEPPGVAQAAPAPPPPPVAPPPPLVASPVAPPAEPAAGEEKKEEEPGGGGEEVAGAGEGGGAAPEGEVFQDKDRAGWIAWLGEHSDSTVMQMKLADLQGLATFMGAEDAGSSKGDALQAIRSQAAVE